MNIKQTNKILDLKDFVGFSKLFVETGTCMGDGLQRAIDAGFYLVESVEAMPDFYRISKNRFRDNLFACIHMGVSYEVLPEIVKHLEYPAVFFLDAHPAGPGTAGHDEVTAAVSDVTFGQDHIITEELKVILAHRNDHLIIIDDLAYGSKEDANYMAMCLKANPNYTFEYYDEKLPNVELRKNKVLVCRP